MILLPDTVVNGWGMLRSSGAVSAAMPSRGDRNAAFGNQEYEVILPPLPTGRIVLNTVFLHADVRGRPYRVEDIRDALEYLGMLPDVEALGAYQMNHVWAVTLKNNEAKKKLLSASQVSVKERRCLVVDPNNQDIRLKLHWVLHHVDDEDVRTAFAPYGKVTEVSRERWRTEGLSEKGSTTRLISLQLKAGYTKEDIPHQLRVAGELTLVVVAGRAPLCLRCKRTGHIRRECRVPRCTSCKRFGHAEEECVKTYAKVAGPSTWDDKTEHQMDESEAEEVAASKTRELQPVDTFPSFLPASSDKPEEPVSVPAKQRTPHSEKSTATPTKPMENTVNCQQTPVEKPERQLDDMMDTKTTPWKRAREETEAENKTPVETNTGEPPTKTAQVRRMSLKPKPNIPPDRHTSGGP
ncbi:uncharacterized protein LOC119377443 [Rhipicephalus sanguineus]|uniref:uncharacterized protein LOC119377443 n=1 Tax=Rhipicephalus sanguineus TaxID=34632 RepID=UPI0018953D12|nr:uncharacterized protein LOC119377443 [Rhipicephalus sanguineus]